MPYYQNKKNMISFLNNDWRFIPLLPIQFILILLVVLLTFILYVFINSVFFSHTNENPFVFILFSIIIIIIILLLLLFSIYHYQKMKGMIYKIIQDSFITIKSIIEEIINDFGTHINKRCYEKNYLGFQVKRCIYHLNLIKVDIIITEVSDEEGTSIAIGPVNQANINWIEYIVTYFPQNLKS